MIAMKSYVNIFSLLILVTAFAACNNEEYTPGAESNYYGYNVYFEQPDATYYSMDPDATEITFKVERDDVPVEDQYVPITLSSVYPEAFQVDDAILFEAGEYTAEVTVYFTESMELFKEYAFSLTIDEDYTQQYLQQTTYPRIDVTVIKEDYEPVYRCRYTCGGVTAGLISWTSPQIMRDLEYSEILDKYRFDPWGHGVYVTFSVGAKNEDNLNELTLDVNSYVTGEVYKSGSEEEDVTATVAGDCTYNDKLRVYTFTFDYGISDASAGVYEDQLQIFRNI